MNRRSRKKRRPERIQQTCERVYTDQNYEVRSTNLERRGIKLTIYLAEDPGTVQIVQGVCLERLRISDGMTVGHQAGKLNNKRKLVEEKFRPGSQLLVARDPKGFQGY